MTITTTLTWTRYDGTDATLPGNSEGWEALEEACDNRSYDEVYPEWRFAECEHRVHVGDLWVPWPEAPEVGA